ncbi:VCBS repeat-containing protein, partial [Paraglaciecola sp. 25GB23A]|uniref:FG-GAP repeat domain-containing protein n=1 Tax=Paraglaciecola sp. 25GB23A TaxID=3156068 RepID=UPI0032B01BBE
MNINRLNKSIALLIALAASLPAHAGNWGTMSYGSGNWGGTDTVPVDTDADGIPDVNDAYPLIAIGDLLDTDNDGAPDQCDAACISIGMAADTDDDNDGVLDVDDAFPLDPTRTFRVKHDVDGDGKSDLLWRSTARGWNFLWAMNGVKTKQASPINVVQDDGWLMAGQGDYDADGKSDIFWRNTITGQNFIYLMDGLTIKTRKVLNFVDAPQWELRGSGDFNGDGKGDVMWRRVDRG